MTKRVARFDSYGTDVYMCTIHLPLVEAPSKPLSEPAQLRTFEAVLRLTLSTRIGSVK